MKLRADDHKGMMVDYQGMLRQAREALQHGRRETMHAEMLRQFQDHLTEMGERFYAGDVAAVDEFLQLYCIARDKRATPVPVDTDGAIQRLLAEMPPAYEARIGIGAGRVTVDVVGHLTKSTIDIDGPTTPERLLTALKHAQEDAHG